MEDIEECRSFKPLLEGVRERARILAQASSSNEEKGKEVVCDDAAQDYQQLSRLLEKNPALVSLLEKQDLRAVVTLLLKDTDAAWSSLSYILVCLIQAD